MKIHANAVIGYVLVGLLAATILVGLVWLPYDPLAIDLDHALEAPSYAHWLGTDEFGRDVASRAMLGARISATIAVQTVAIAIVVGSALGVLAGFFRGWTDRLLMTVNDALLAFPGILLALALIAVLGSSRHSIVIALAIAYLPATVRVVRSAVLSIREREYVEASKVAGDAALYTMWRHVLPNALPPIIVLATSLFGWVVLSESALSFLGVGVPPPAPTWGNMLSSARPYMYTAAWLSVAPGLCIVATLLGINMLGDALRDRIDPRGKR
ncbi:ABC transporter permease [Sphingomonas sp. JC676]|uniref:ABC transporter permease n=1 Tax=Sphingomonas sp. JC676 TaxID=2768065 RepID=UPI001657EA93|nr:ABC transporter permease [Sphingomonas sp. JC676]MBC9033744.1 ABC transporter permease [Sphingomonas sp. JC676]